MKHEDVHDLLYGKRYPEPKIEPFPICKTCGESFLGYSGDKFCIECENEGKTQTKRVK